MQTREPMAHNDKGEKTAWSTTQTPKLAWLSYSGSTVPNVFGSFMNAISWKGLSLTPIFTYQFGAVMRAPVTYVRATNPVLEDISRRWRKAGDENVTEIPGLYTTPNEPWQRRLFYAQNSNKVVSADFNPPQRAEPRPTTSPGTGRVIFSKNVPTGCAGHQCFPLDKKRSRYRSRSHRQKIWRPQPACSKTWTVQLKLDF